MLVGSGNSKANEEQDWLERRIRHGWSQGGSARSSRSKKKNRVICRQKKNHDSKNGSHVPACGSNKEPAGWRWLNRVLILSWFCCWSAGAAPPWLELTCRQPLMTRRGRETAALRQTAGYYERENVQGADVTNRVHLLQSKILLRLQGCWILNLKNNKRKFSLWQISHRKTESNAHSVWSSPCFEWYSLYLIF